MARRAPAVPASRPSRPEDPAPLVLTVRDTERIDRLLARDLPLSRTRVRSLLESGRVSVDGRVVERASLVPPEGSLVRVRLPAPEPSDLAADPIPLRILYEDDALVAIDKPAGLVVHPAPGHLRGTLVNALLARGTFAAGTPAAGAAGERPGIVHRLDRETSGVIVVAKNERAHAALAALFKARQVGKLYDAVAWGHLPEERGTIERPIGRSRTDRQKMAVDLRRGRAALTHWRVRERFAVADHLELDLATGRTHQIRVHLASLGHPLVGDARYGGGPGVERGFQGPQRSLVRAALAAAGRTALHARRVELRHPETGARLVFEAPLPPDLAGLVELLRERRA